MTDSVNVRPGQFSFDPIGLLSDFVNAPSELLSVDGRLRIGVDDDEVWGLSLIHI